MRTHRRLLQAVGTRQPAAAGAALEVLATKNLERKAGLPSDLKNILTDVVENKEPSAILGRVMIASRLAILHDIDGLVAAFEARAKEVTSFGTITRGVQVYGTPTLLVLNKKGQVRTITGLTDAYAIEQTIDEARHG